MKTANGWRNITGQYVEAVQLQVVGQTLWRSLAPEENEITRDHLDRFGNVDRALVEFYERAISLVAVGAGIKEGILRRWFDNSLITPDNTRGVVYQGPKDTGGIPNAVVELLVDQRLVRGEVRGGGIWYELAHDRLIKPIQDSNKEWVLRHSGSQQMGQRLERLAEEWANNEAQLLDQVELLEAQRWMESLEAAEVGYSDQLSALVSASRAAVVETVQMRANEQSQNIRRLRILAVILALVSLVALLVIVLLLKR
jgi:hypothetical protein